MKKKLEIFIFGLLGLMFVFSALIKLFPIEAFELQLIKLQLFNWENSPYFARLLIILEFTFGLFLLQKNNIKKIFVPIAFLLLQLFNVILVFQLIYLPEVKNCGCFGEFLPMTPIQALIKNIFLSLILIYVYRNNIKVGVNSYIIIVLVIISIIAILIMFPIKKYKIQSIVATKTETVVNNFAIQKQGTNLNGTTVFEKKDTHLVIKKSATKKTLSIFTSYKKFNGVRNEIDLNSGLKIVALFSLDCDECRNTAIKLKNLTTELNNLEIYTLYLGDINQLNEFTKTSKTNFPYIILTPQEFFPFIKGYPPRIVLLHNGNIIYDWDYNSLNINQLQNYFQSNSKL